MKLKLISVLMAKTKASITLKQCAAEMGNNGYLRPTLIRQSSGKGKRGELETHQDDLEGGPWKQGRGGFQ